MREIFTDQDHARVGFYKSILDEAEIPNFIRNESATNISLPTPIFFPTLCVVHDEDYEEALRLLRAVTYEQPAPAADWRCPKCQEEVPGNFDSCWQCGTLRTGLADVEGGGGD